MQLVSSAASASTDATLSGLELENPADMSAISLTPAFDADTTAYAASVANGVSSVTVKATASSTEATIEYLDAGGRAIADADGDAANGHQAPIGIGANAITVKVTAGNRVSTRSYTVTVTRAAGTDPVVSIEADSDSAVYLVDAVSWTVSRTGPTADALTVSVQLTQDRTFLTNLSRSVTIAAGDASATLTVPASEFRDFHVVYPRGTPVRPGVLTAAVMDGTGYDAGAAGAASADILIGRTVGFDKNSYTVDEADGALAVKLVMRTGVRASRTRRGGSYRRRTPGPPKPARRVRPRTMERRATSSVSCRATSRPTARPSGPSWTSR